jgi:hypothetical protein
VVCGPKTVKVITSWSLVPELAASVLEIEEAPMVAPAT